MTTGRINQVTTFRPCTPKDATHDSRDSEVTFSFGSSSIGRRFSCNLRERSALPHTSYLKPTTETPYSPVSQISDALLPVACSNRDHGLRRELPTTGHVNQDTAAVAADSQVVKCNRFSYQQVIHSLLHCKHQKCSTL
jgi:hypothetical protein